MSPHGSTHRINSPNAHQQQQQYNQIEGSVGATAPKSNFEEQFSPS
jgi:hypothetical protein